MLVINQIPRIRRLEEFDSAMWTGLNCVLFGEWADVGIKGA